MKRWLGALAALTLLLALLLGWRYANDADRPPPSVQQSAGEAALDDPALILRGKYLAIVGDCAACHTARGGQRYAGGRSLATPFGDVPAPNLTPDPDTGIGKWNFEDFWRALHEGRGRHGELLYPVFSYTSFTRVTRDDARAIFAYLHSLPPVQQAPTPLGLAFPYDVRSSLLAWRALYFNPGQFQPDPARSAAWNRGAYLVQGLGHCDECHAPRNQFGGIEQHGRLTGGLIPQLEWYAPDLSTQRDGGLEGWSAQDIVDLLRDGQSAKGAAFGPMAEVVHNSTQYMTEADLHDMATYLQSLPPRSPAATRSTPALAVIDTHGAAIYSEQCAECHGTDGNGVVDIYPPLNGNTSVDEPSGINAIRSVLLGGFPPVTAGNRRPYSMPPFAKQLSDHDIAAVVSHIRQSWSNKAPAVSPSDVTHLRQAPND